MKLYDIDLHKEQQDAFKNVKIIEFASLKSNPSDSHYFTNLNVKTDGNTRFKKYLLEALNQSTQILIDKATELAQFNLDNEEKEGLAYAEKFIKKYKKS